MPAWFVYRNGWWNCLVNPLIVMNVWSCLCGLRASDPCHFANELWCNLDPTWHLATIVILTFRCTKSLIFCPIILTNCILSSSSLLCCEARFAFHIYMLNYAGAHKNWLSFTQFLSNLHIGLYPLVAIHSISIKAWHRFNDPKVGM